MMHCISKIMIDTYPVIFVTFSDGVRGPIDLSTEIETLPIFADLKDKALFQRVQIGPNGASMGWRMDQIGNEIDLSADGLRSKIETQIVKQWAEEYRSGKQAAE
jgi:hypothetical protein